jgi:hypothetical protein
MPCRDPRPVERPKMVLYQLANMFWCSKLYCIQTTVPPLITKDFFQTCIRRDLTIPSFIIVSVTGTCKLDQGYCMPTMAGSVKDDQVWSLCPSCSTLQQYSGSRGQTLGNPQCVSRRSHASRLSFPGSLCGYNEQEHRKLLFYSVPSKMAVDG